MSKKRSNKLRDAKEIIQGLPKPRKKQALAPTDINIPSLPLFRVSTKSEKIYRWESSDETIGIGFFKGQPSINAQKILTYLFTKIPRTKGGMIDINELEANGVAFTLAELCRLLGVVNETKNRRTIQEDLERLGNVTLHFHKGYLLKNKKTGVYRKGVEAVGLFKLDILDSQKNREISDEQMPIFKSYIKFHELILENLKSNNYRLVGTEEMLQLKSAVAVRVHGIISMHNQSKVWRIGLERLAEQIPIKARQTKHRKETIKRACDELKKVGIFINYVIYKNEGNEDVIEFIFQE